MALCTCIQCHFFMGLSAAVLLSAYVRLYACSGRQRCHSRHTRPATAAIRQPLGRGIIKYDN